MLIAASIVLCSWSVMFKGWISRTDTRWLLSLQLALILLASTINNVYIAFTVAWIAVHPWVVHITFSRRMLPFSPTGVSTFQPLIPILWWGAMYVVLKHYPVSYVVVAYAIIAWGLINAASAIYTDRAKSLPPYFIDGRTSYSPNSPGLVGGSFMLAFLTSAGFISGMVLLTTAKSYLAITLLTLISLILAFSSIHTGTLSPIMFAYVVLILWHVRNPLILIPALAVISAASYYKLTRPEHRASFDSRFPAWKDAFNLGRDTYFFGIGLGMWNAITNPPLTMDQHDTEWRNLHNDYLQSLVELGPVPCICAVLFLASSWLALYPLATTSQLFGLLMTSYIAMYAFVYFPMRDHMPALLLAVSMSML